MDISDTLAPKTDQLDAVDLLGGPRTFTVVSVRKTEGEQPIHITLAEFPRVWRPGKSMRRVLAAAWGSDASKWGGRRVTLFCDPTVRYGGSEVGGTRISHMSDLPDGKPLAVPLLISQGRSGIFRVQPLPDAPKPPTLDQINATDDIDTLKGMWKAADPEGRARIEARVAQLTEQA